MSIEAMQRWLECAERCESIDGMYSWADTITAIKAALEAHKALAQPEQEPVGEVSKAGFGDYPVICWRKGYVAKIGDKFYTTPPQRKPLTDEEIGAILEGVNAYGTRLYTFARAIEAAHGITSKDNT